MPTQNTSNLKENILLLLKQRGPSLPVHIAQKTGLSMLFAGAFLSELFSEHKIKISNMKVGNSPIYFIRGQEPLIANFAQHLKSREKDAFMLLKEKKFLKDTEQQPAIRVALRSIKDFAIPFKKNKDIYWRYLTTPESELQLQEHKPEVKKVSIPITKIFSEPVSRQLNIFDKTPTKKKKVSRKKNDKFFNKVKEFLSKKQIEILDIENFNKNELILRINGNNREQLLIAFNKKRINDTDLIKASKKAKELNLHYVLLSLGEPLKKLINLIEAIKDLNGLEKIE